MASPRTWLNRAQEILAILGKMRSDHLDRPAIEELFELQRRAAITLMNQVGSSGERGASAVVTRKELIAWVKKTYENESYILERHRTATNELSRASEEIRAVRAALHKEGRAPVPFPLVDEVLQTSFTSLPSSIRVEPGYILVEVGREGDPEQIVESACQQLFSLAMAIANDSAGFQKLLTPGGPLLKLVEELVER